MTDNTAGEEDERAPLIPQPPVPSEPDLQRPKAPTADEESQLSGLRKHSVGSISTVGLGARTVTSILASLLLGLFVANADGSLVLTTHALIASEFRLLSESSWIVVSYSIALCAVQAIYGKLSDIYGRKPILLFCYGIFGLGCALVGIANSLFVVILGRVISGIGGAGMQALVSIIITDLVPLREVAAWRSYANVAATVGRSLGGPLGGYLADTIGWRWSFLGQVPLMMLTMLLSWWLVPRHVRDAEDTDEVRRSRLSRVDFVGAAFLGSAIIAFLLPMELGGQRLSWADPRIICLFVIAFVLAGFFVRCENQWAKEPVFPISLLTHRDVIISYPSMALQVGAQVGIMYTVPIYFQVTASASASIAGAHLFPAVAGNAVGGLITGLVIRKSGRYKALTILAMVTSIVAYTLLIVRWKGDTNWLESLYIVPGGFGSGIVQSALFISLQAGLEPSDMAVASSGLYLSGSLGMLVGLAFTSSIQQTTLRAGLREQLRDSPQRDEVLRKAFEDVGYVRGLTGDLRRRLVRGYVYSLECAHGYSLACAAIGFLVSLFMRERKI